MKEKLTCYIIDDEPLAQEILEAYIGKVPFLELKGTFSSALEATAWISQDAPDLLFLDINMPDLDGLSFIPMLNPKPVIILTTAYDQYALKAFDLQVKDYLLKPISFERFYKSVFHIHQGQSGKQPEKVKQPETAKESEFIFLKSGNRIQKIATNEILFIESMKDYLRIHTATEKIMTLLSFAKLEELLPVMKFARVHRSYMVAIDKIAHIERKRIKIGENLIPISDGYAEEFFQKLKGM